MSQKVLEEGLGARIRKRAEAFAQFLALEVDGLLWRIDRKDSRSVSLAFLVVLIGALVFCLAATGAFLMFKANHLLVSHLLFSTYSKSLALKFAVLFLFAETAIIVAFAVQNRRRMALAARLRLSEDRLAFAAISADMGLWAWDAETDRFWSTEHCERMFGIPPGTQFTMAAMRDVVHPDDRAMVDRALARGAESGSTFEIECRMNIAGGGMRWVRCRAGAMRDAGGRVRHLSGTIVDITDRKRMTAEVEAQRQSLSHLMRVGMIGELSGGLAHELNQPLTAIMSNAQAAQRLIGRPDIDLGELRGAIADIIANGVRAGEVIRRLRALLKKEDMRRQRIDLNDIAAETLGLARSELIARHLNVSFHPGDEPAPVIGDAIQLQQVLLNLILNAAEAMEPGGMLNLSVAVEVDGMRHISVADTGPGVHAEALGVIFDPFFSTKAHGLGLGLSISRSIVATHGGEIWAENNPGRGATFHVALPPQHGVTHAERQDHA
jgi:PAS domain S-box-containing protein